MCFRKKAWLISIVLIIAFTFVSCLNDGISKNYNDAKQYFLSGNYDSALKSIDVAIEKDNKQAAFYLLKAYILYKSSAPLNDVIAQCTNALEIDENNIEAKILKANCLAENKDNSYEAIMEDITSKTYDDANILVGIAEVYETAGNYEQALAYYEEALKIKDDINIKSYMIQCYIDLQDYENAINLCDEIIDKDPNNMDALEKKIFSLNELEKYNEAVDLANNSLKINTSYAVFYYELYYAYFNLDDYDLSLANINKYIELNPDEAEGYLYRAKLEKELGDTSNVEQDMQVYIAKGGDKEKGDVFLND